MSDQGEMSAFDKMFAARVTMQDQIDELTARLNTEHAERVATDDHAGKATEEAVALLRSTTEPLARFAAMEEAVHVLQAQAAAWEKRWEDQRASTKEGPDLAEPWTK